MKLLPIRGIKNHKKGVIIAYTKVDDEDFEILSKYPWYSTSKKNRLTYVENKKLGKLHRFIMGYPFKKEVDHKNGDTLDNQRKNLRICLKFQNMANMKIIDRNKSGFKNIKEKPKGRYEVSFKNNCKTIYIGTFLSLNDAIKARDKAVKKIRGEFARLG